MGRLLQRATMVPAVTFAVATLAVVCSGCAPARPAGAAGSPVNPQEGRNGALLAQLAAHCIFNDPDGRTSLTKHDWVRALGESRDPVAYNTLATLLVHKDYVYLRDAAAEAVARIDDPRVYPLLEHAIADGRIRMAKGIYAMGLHQGSYYGGEQATRFILRQLKESPDGEVRLAAARFAGIVVPRREPTAAALTQAADGDASMQVRVVAASRLLCWGHRQYVPFLRQAQADRNPWVRTLLVLYAPVQEETMPIFLALLADEDEQVAAATWEQLEKMIGNEETARSFVTLPPSRAGREAMVEKYRAAWEAYRASGRGE